MTLSDAELAIVASAAGAAVVRAKYDVPLGRIAKSSTDFATDADVEAEQAILRTLRSERPEDAVLGEETGYTGHDRSARTWLVDPLCGTLNYAAHTPLVAVNVALRVRDEVTVAVSADPFADELFWTDGDGARRRHEGVDEPLAPSADSALVDVNLDGPYPNDATFRAVRLLADPRFTQQFRPRVLSTTLAVAWVAAGRRAAYVTDGDLRNNVHFASGIALCQAAGCVVTDLQGHPVDAGAGGLVAAADGETHETLISIIQTQPGL